MIGITDRPRTLSLVGKVISEFQAHIAEMCPGDKRKYDSYIVNNIDHSYAGMITALRYGNLQPCPYLIQMVIIVLEMDEYWQRKLLKAYYTMLFAMRRKRITKESAEDNRVAAIWLEELMKKLDSKNIITSLCSKAKKFFKSIAGWFMETMRKFAEAFDHIHNLKRDNNGYLIIPIAG